MIKINGVEIEQNHFPDGTLLMRIPKDSKFIMQFEWQYENDAELFSLICARKHYWNHVAHLSMKYVPHARMDRVKNSEDVFTLKYFCEIINSLNFQRVYVLDVHSNVSLALLENVVQLPVLSYIEHAMDKIPYDENKRLILFYPDEGAMKRYSDIKNSYAFGIKRRNWETGKIEGLDIQNKKLIAGNDILIVDDICSKGGTFYHSAKALKEAGAANIYLYVTHLEESVLSGDLWKAMNDYELIEKIYTANPLFNITEPISNFIVRV